MHRTAMTLIAVITTALMMAWVAPALAQNAEKVNINTATKDELMTLDGIGGTNADRIIEFRDKNGPFQVPEDILKVKGIGQKTFEINQERIIVSEE